MAYTIMTYIVMAYVIMVYIVMAYIVMAHSSFLLANCCWLPWSSDIAVQNSLKSTYIVTAIIGRYSRL